MIYTGEELHVYLAEVKIPALYTEVNIEVTYTLNDSSLLQKQVDKNETSSQYDHREPYMERYSHPSAEVI